MTNVKKSMGIGFFGAILTLAMVSSVIMYPLASALVNRPPNWSFEEGTLGSVPDNWLMKTQDYTSSPPPTSTYIHEVRDVDTHYFSGNRSCWLHSRVVDTDGTVLARYSWTWIEPKDPIYQPDATHVRFFIRDIQPTHSRFWGWNDEIWLGFNDSVTVRNIHLYNNGETLNFNYYNDTKVGADGATWFEYIYPIPADINKSHMKVQIICIAGDWTFYDTSYFADMSFCVDDVEILYESNWPVFHHDLQHTGYSTSKAPSTNHIIWTYATGGEVGPSSPAIIDSRLYIGSNDNKVYCLNATTGAFIWSYTTGWWVQSSPAVADGRVYVGSYDRNVYCLNATTGTYIWSFTTSDMVQFSPAVAFGRVYVGSMDHNVYCLNATTGAFIWSYTTGDYIVSSPAVVDSRVYIGSRDHNVYCLNATSGAYLWSYATGNTVFSPTVFDNKVYVGSDDRKVYCLNATTGAFIWSYVTGNPVFSTPAVAYGRVYVGSYDSNVYCLNSTTGAHLWSYATGSWISWSSPAVADGKVYVGSSDHNVYCLNATTGANLWSYTTGWYVASSPAIAYGKVYVGSNDGAVYCFGPLPYAASILAHCNTEDVDVSVSIGQDGFSTDYTTPFAFSGLTYTHTFAVPNTDSSGHIFKQWNTGETSTTITVGSEGTYTAYYQAQFTLTITTTEGGTTSPEPGTYSHWEGAVLPVAAIPSPDYLFDHWELNGSNAGSTNPISVTMDTNRSLKAFFVSPPVGGFVVSVDKLGLLAPYIGLASTIIVAAVATAIIIKRVRCGKEKQ